MSSFFKRYFGKPFKQDVAFAVVVGSLDFMSASPPYSNWGR